jgi:hypothetical protein
VKTTLTTLLAIATLSSCTENVRARQFGGNMTVELPPNTKLVGATWKEAHLWYLYRPIHQGETPEVSILQESSNFGMMEGTVTFVEK